jgi:hypothetical protein
MVSSFGLKWEIAVASADHQEFIGQSVLQLAG